MSTDLEADALAYWNWSAKLGAEHGISRMPFFLTPLYPYVLAMVRILTGDHIPAVFAIQAVWGATAVVLIADASRRLVGSIAAAAGTGLFIAGYGMWIALDVQVLTESLLLLAGSFLIWLMAARFGRLPLLLGVVMAVMATGRPTFLLLLPVTIAFSWRAWTPHRARSLARVLVPSVLMLIVTGAHHARVGGGWVPVSYNGGYNLYLGNGPEANGTYVPFAHDEPSTPADTSFLIDRIGDGRAYLERTYGLRLNPVESSRFFTRLALQQMRRDPGRALRLMARKLGMLFNHWEVSQISNARIISRVAGPLGWPEAVAFPILLVFALLGVPGLWREGPRGRWLVSELVVIALGLATFFVVDRYRIHLVPVLAVMMSAGIRSLMAAVRAPGITPWAARIPIAAGALALTFLPVVPRSPAHDEWEYRLTLGESELKLGHLDSAQTLLERADRIDRRDDSPEARTISARFARAEMCQALGVCYEEMGRPEAALSEFERAVEILPRLEPPRARLAQVLGVLGRWERAEREVEHAGWSREQAAAQFLQTAERFEARSDPVSTAKYLEAATVMDPANEMAQVALLRLSILGRDFPRAQAALLRAREGGVDGTVMLAHRAWLERAVGDTAASRRSLDSIPAAILAMDPRVIGTIRLMSLQASR